MQQGHNQDGNSTFNTELFLDLSKITKCLRVSEVITNLRLPSNSTHFWPCQEA